MKKNKLTYNIPIQYYQNLPNEWRVVPTVPAQPRRIDKVKSAGMIKVFTGMANSISYPSWKAKYIGQVHSVGYDFNGKMNALTNAIDEKVLTQLGINLLVGIGRKC